MKPSNIFLFFGAAFLAGCAGTTLTAFLIISGR